MEQPEGAHAKQAEPRISAEETFVRWQAKSRVDRALHSKGRNWPEYCPGNLVFFWRSYVKQKQDGKRIQTGSIGGYAGPARILALETRRDEDGKVKASSVVWLVRNNRLLKAIQQLRAASEREQLLFEMERPPDMPWTMTELARPLARTAYDDITQELPPSREMHSSDKIARYWVTPPGRRVRGKTEDPSFEKDDGVTPMEIQPSPTAGPSRARAPERASGSSAAAPSSSARPQKARSRSRPKPVDEDDDELYAHYGDIPECSYWQEEAAAVAIELELPTTRNGWKQMSKNPQTFLANMMKKKAVEVHERHMDLDWDQREVPTSKTGRNEQIFEVGREVLPQHLQPSKDQAMQMRWLLTWKVDGDGKTVPKARIVILGYQDPQYEHRVTYAPTTTRHTQQLMLQYAAGRQWWSWKGDVAAAFLQGRECKEDLYCIPTPELCELLQIPKESVSRLRKTCYGLVQAPYEWYETVREFLLSIGYTQLGSDPCCWILKVDDKVHAIICGHVDDFMFVADPKDPIWLESKKRIQDHFRWGEFEENKFTQCGVQITRQEDGGYHLSQERYMEHVKEIPLSQERRKNRKEPTTDHEKTLLRGILGAMSWHCSQVGFRWSAYVSLALSEIPQSTVEHVEQTNALLHKMKNAAREPLRIHPIPHDQVGMFAWVDASSQNRVGGHSTKGIFIGAAHIGTCWTVMFQKRHPCFGRAQKSLVYVERLELQRLEQP